MDEASITVTGRSRPGCVPIGDSGCLARYHDCAPVLLERKNFDLWLSGDALFASGDFNPASLLRPAREDSLQEWIVSSRVNRSGVGNDDPMMIEPLEIA